jgi:hypothetical protein
VRWIRRAKAFRFCVHHHPDHFCVFQHLRGQYNAAIYESWTVERLPVWGMDVHRAEPVRQDCPGVADLVGYTGADLGA